MLEKDKRDIVSLYEKRLKEYGASVKTLGWRDKKQQCLRFRMLSKIGRLNNKKILDVGCGFGGLYYYLKTQGYSVDYTGYDLSQKIVSAAKALHPGLRIEKKDILKDKINERFDYVLASGILNKRISCNMLYARKLIKAMYKLCRFGLAVNMFTTNVDYQEPHLFYYPIKDIIKFSKTLRASVGMKRNYPLYDYTFYLVRKAA